MSVNKTQIVHDVSTLLIKWTDKSRVGIPILDEQHRGLTATINSLFYACHNDLDSKMISAAIALIMGHAKVHFLTEEHFMERIGYPDLARHRKEHEALISSITTESHEALEMRDTAIFLNFLKTWYSGHVSKSDRMYAEYFRKLS